MDFGHVAIAGTSIDLRQTQQMLSGGLLQIFLSIESKEKKRKKEKKERDGRGLQGDQSESRPNNVWYLCQPP
jgi:hypothetical protein